MAYRSFSSLEFEARGVRKVTTGIVTTTQQTQMDYWNASSMMELPGGLATFGLLQPRSRFPATIKWKKDLSPLAITE